jgi:hypothetical protein
MNPRLPQNFVRHPIANAWKSSLHQQNRFDWRARMAREKIADSFQGKIGGQNLGWQTPPPGRLLGADLK